MAIFRVEKDKNYTVMSNFHLQDRKLSLKAKGLLSLMLSLPESWDYTTRGLACISKEGESAITSTLKELEERGYLTRRRLRNEQGHLCETEYTIHEKSSYGDDGKKAKKAKNRVSPNCENPRLENTPVGEEAPKTEGFCDGDVARPNLDCPDLDFPGLDSPALVFPCEEEPNLENRRQYSTKPFNKNILNTQAIKSLSNQSHQSRYSEMDMDSIDRQRMMIQNNIEYEPLCLQYGQDRVDDIVGIVLEVLCNPKAMVRISGIDYPSTLVRERLMSLTFSHIQYVFDCLDANPSDIRNIKAYLLTTLFNAPATMDSYYIAKVAHDMAL